MKGMTLVELLAAFLLVSLISLFAFSLLLSGQGVSQSLSVKTKAGYDFETVLSWFKSISQTAVKITATTDGQGFYMMDAVGRITHVRLISLDQFISSARDTLICTWQDKETTEQEPDDANATPPDPCPKPLFLNVCRPPLPPARAFQNEGEILHVTLQCADILHEGYLFPLTR
ncbi:MAG: hypothetical protein BSOLF_1928 [Candidatus Carbobacillus altaicus]|uniref:Prepilin-type N-terminal cleavage/methylation domain-containing protein n=1 Tax=Candidatus Carbonibacillus altaicus TaxID=2163959 RepID=A0A2R6XYL8_9BACL|nr:MAG: hypothetical protein BSOLF_1928 [Candidatus Carbobacillus altaicus]